MGAEPYWYFVPYEADVESALQKLRQREFMAGRYSPVIDFPEFPISASSPSPGAQHDSIEDARAEAAEEGTRSILDLDRVSDEPEICAVSPLEEALLEEHYGSVKPTREMVEEDLAFLEHLDRGEGRFVTLYKDGAPDEILFAGYSFD